MGAAPYAGGHPREGAELVNHQQALGKAVGQAVRSPTAMLTLGIDKKNSSSAHSIASMLVWTRTRRTRGRSDQHPIATTMAQPWTFRRVRARGSGR